MKHQMKLTLALAVAALALPSTQALPSITATVSSDYPHYVRIDFVANGVDPNLPWNWIVDGQWLTHEPAPHFDYDRIYQGEDNPGTLSPIPIPFYATYGRHTVEATSSLPDPLFTTYDITFVTIGPGETEPTDLPPIGGAVPEGGATAGLLGIGLAGVASLRRLVRP